MAVGSESVIKAKYKVANGTGYDQVMLSTSADQIVEGVLRTAAEVNAVSTTGTLPDSLALKQIYKTKTNVTHGTNPPSNTDSATTGDLYIENGNDYSSYYYTKGTAYSFRLPTSGLLQSNYVYIDIPLGKLIPSNVTSATISNFSCMFRQKGEYHFGSSGSTYATPTPGFATDGNSATAAAAITNAKQYGFLKIRVTGTLGSNAQNLQPMGLYGSVTITFS